jgi:hypothetical protein
MLFEGGAAFKADDHFIVALIEWHFVIH